MEKKQDNSGDWFEKWFNEDYDLLYGEKRTDKQAIEQVKGLIDRIATNVCLEEEVVLDAACGNGRHFQALQELGYQSHGFDLSSWLLNKAQNRFRVNSSLVRADMRSLPYLPGSFKLICSFFSSFGYFIDANDDQKVISEMSRVMKNGGIYFLDLMNPHYIKSSIVSFDTKELSGMTVRQERYLQGNLICKDIIMSLASGGEKRFHERVRLWELDEIVSLAAQNDFKLLNVYGDEFYDDFKPESSPRMSLVLQKLS